MSTFADELRQSVSNTVKTGWSSVKGQVVPQSVDLKHGNDRKVLDATFLYADLADSTELAIKNPEQAAEVCKAYLAGVSKLIKKNDGEIRSFDGDRVMGVFLTGAKNTNAAKCALQVNYFFKQILVKEFRDFYVSMADVNLAQTVGIDTGEVHAVRAGVRNDNDLIWIGAAPNIAAKASAVRNSNAPTFITKRVYDVILDSSKFAGSGEAQQNMWKRYTWDAGKAYGTPELYGSSWHWEP